MASQKKLIAVVGATGNQGGSLVQELLKDGKFSVRALTRDATSDAAKKLKDQGVEVVQGSSENKDDLNRLFQGAYGAFAMTDSRGQSEKEFDVGKLMADAAKEAGVQHYVWSTLANAEERTKGKIPLKGFTDKAKVDDHIKSIGLPTTFFLLGAFFPNWFTRMPPQIKEDGSRVWSAPLRPDVALEHIDPTDTGKLVIKAFNDPATWIGKYISAASQKLTPGQIMEEYTKVTGNKAEYVYVPPEEFAKIGFYGPIGAQIYGYVNDYGHLDPANLPDWSNGVKLVPELTTFSQWLNKSRGKYPAL